MTEDIFQWKPTDVKIFLGTPEEKEKKEWAGYVELNHTGYNNGKKVLIAEGVNTGEWHDRVKRIQWETQVKTMKILFDMSIEDSMVRVLRRDHDKKWYAFQTILEHRLREYYYILKLYLEPALKDPETIILSKAREVPLFLESEKREILAALAELFTRFDSDPVLLYEQKEFILKLIQELQKIFSSAHGASDNEMKLWKKQKSLKKHRRDYKREKKTQNDGALTRKDTAHEIKKLKKGIKKIKKIIKHEKQMVA